MINEERRIIQTEALDVLEKHNYNGIIILPTGTGKSYVLVEALKRLYKPNMSVLYACDSIRLRDVDFDIELEKWGAKELSDVIEKTCYASAYKFRNRHFNIALIDEGDYGLTPAYSKLFTENTFDHIIFVSATLDRKKRIIAKDILPPVIYEKKIKEIEKAKVINKSQFYYVPYRLNEKENAKYLYFNKLFSNALREPDTPARTKRLQYISFNRLSFLASLESSVYICKRLITELHKAKPDIRMLVFCTHTEQADKICKYTYHTGNADEGNLDKFHNREINTIGICGKIDRGVNIDSVNTQIIESASGSETKMIQKTGRGRRLDVDDTLDVYFLVPYYSQLKMNRLKVYPTIVLSKIQTACRNMGIENAKTYTLKMEGTNEQ